MHSLQHLNISHNTLSELDGSILSSCKQIVELDVSHNQIAILKLNEVNKLQSNNCVDCFHERTFIPVRSNLFLINTKPDS